MLAPYLKHQDPASLPAPKKGIVQWGVNRSSTKGRSKIGGGAAGVGVGGGSDGDFLNEADESRKDQSRDPLNRSISYESLIHHKGPFFIFTITDGLFYIAGGIAGSRKGSRVCLITATTLGAFIFLIGIAHAIDYYRNAPLEPGYIIIPACINFIIGVLMSIHYNMAEGRAFWPSGMVMTASFGALVFFIFAFVREFGERIARGSIENLRSLSLPLPTSKDHANRYRKLRMDIKSKTN